MLKPKALQAGDRIAVVAPASPFDRADFDRGVAELCALGFEPTFDPSIFERRAYVAGSAESRARAFHAAWIDRSVRGVIGARGGYGSVQILPYLDAERLRADPKVFIGYSDLTSLLIFLGTGCGIVCFHGPMLEGKLAHGPRGYDRGSLVNAVMRAEPLGELTAPSLDVLRHGSARGELFGGTLTQIVASLGTPYGFDPPAGCVLFLDEVNERPYRLDRMLVQLRLAGVLARTAAIVFGELPGCDEPGGEITARAAITEALGSFEGPVLIGFPSGHTTAPAVTLPLGVSARVETTPRPRLIVEESAVAP